MPQQPGPPDIDLVDGQMVAGVGLLAAYSAVIALAGMRVAATRDA